MFDFLEKFFIYLVLVSGIYWVVYFNLIVGLCDLKSIAKIMIDKCIFSNWVGCLL